jgi:hypothetical protein
VEVNSAVKSGINGVGPNSLECRIMSAVRFLVLVSSLLAAALWGEFSFAPRISAAADDTKEKTPPKKPKGKFTIGKDTTYVTRPLDKDGYVDYAAALNEWLSKGVTPENNASVLLWKALGPHPDGATMPAGFFKLLGMEKPPEKGDYFIELIRYAKEQLKLEEPENIQEFEEQLDHAKRFPWTEREHPRLAAWLKANEKPLALVIEATKRSHCFSPVLPPRREKGPSWLIDARVPGVYQSREIAGALAARVMLRTGQGAAGDAWQDLLACHRLGRLVGRGATLLDGLAGFSIEGTSSRAALAFLAQEKLDAKQLANCLRDLQELPPLPGIARQLDLSERFLVLDSLMMIVRQSVGYLDRLAASRTTIPSSLPQDIIERWRVEGLTDIDWDRALTNANRWYDRLAAAARESDRKSRDKKLDQIVADVKALKTKRADPEELVRRLRSDAGARGEFIGDIVIGLLLPSADRLAKSADRVQQVHDNVILAFALACYQRELGRYPKELAALAPKYLERIPQDLFSGQPLIYRPKENGYLLYSVGVNGKDEDGRGYEDDPPGDDLSVRMPLPEVRTK